MGLRKDNGRSKARLIHQHGPGLLMAEKTYERLVLAKGQLDTALDLFLEQRNFASAITLAGAAEEICCNASTKGALNMAKLGFRVKELIGGLDWCKRDNHKTEGGTASTKSAACG